MILYHQICDPERRIKTIILHSFKVTSRIWRNTHCNTWTGLPFSELDIVVANRVAIFWSSWKRNHKQINFYIVINTYIKLQATKMSSHRSYENSRKLHVFCMLHFFGWTCVFFYIALPQCCFFQTNCTGSSLPSSHQSDKCTTLCNNLHYKIYQHPP